MVSEFMVTIMVGCGGEIVRREMAVVMENGQQKFPWVSSLLTFSLQLNNSALEGNLRCQAGRNSQAPQLW